jgi:hypothetical protein
VGTALYLNFVVSLLFSCGSKFTLFVFNVDPFQKKKRAQLSQQTEQSSHQVQCVHGVLGVSNDMVVAEGDLYLAFRSFL